MLKKLLLSLFCAILSAFSYAYDFEVDGITYNIKSLSDRTVYVSGITTSGDIVIPESVSYNNYVFSVDSLGSLFDCIKTKSIRFSKKINTNGHVLYGCGTAYFYVDPDNPYMTAVDGILYSKDMSRLICYPPSKTGSDFTIPNSVTSIDDYSFGANKYLRKLIFNDNIEELPEYFLYGTDYSGGVTYLKLSNKIKIIHGRCLYGMNSIKTLILPKDLEEVEKDRDWGYYGLPTSPTEITIYNSKIVNYTYALAKTTHVFSRFSNLVNLHICDESPVALDEGVFTDGNYFTINLYVPKGSKSSYQTTEGWKNFYNIIEEDPENKDSENKENCATPTISYEDGEITFYSETPNATFHYEISSGDMGAGVSTTNTSVSLSGEYKISVYATAVGYNASEITTATLQWTEGKLEEKKQPSTPSLDGHEYVDLGLPSGKLWATTNLDSPTPESYGGYFMYGNMNSYATSEWGTNWEIPTKEDYEELLRYCTWTWSSIGVFNGYTVTGENGNSLFLPAAGCVLMGGSSQGANSQIYYWTKTASSTMANMAYMLSGNSSSINANIAYNTSITYAPVRLVVKNTTNAIEKTVNVQTIEKNVAIYDINGIKQVKQKKGINLMKMSNGTTKKIIIK